MIIVILFGYSLTGEGIHPGRADTGAIGKTP
jgi:hypothetical protein